MLLAMDFIQNPQVSLLICPAVRFASNKAYKKIGLTSYFTINSPNGFSYVKDDNSSHSRHRLNLLFWCNNKESEHEFRCGACRCKSIGTTYYFCNECNTGYHKECVESPSLTKSLYHPKHDLQLIKFNELVDFDEDYFMFFDWDKLLFCCYCGSNLSHLFYYCSICRFSIDIVCARKPPILNYQKTHEHTLTYFPRKINFKCDVCGYGDDRPLIYVCLQCDFIVHKTCVYLPFVIKISRHKHRISFTYSSPSTSLVCGVCRQIVDENCGKYSCMKDCTYVVHPKCATLRDVWDGKELEDEPEEVYENLNSFEVIGDGIIQHFSHPHRMRLENTTDMLYDEYQKCQACVLPFYDGDVYKCMNLKCDFVLHEACANLPRKKQHMAYPNPLTLQISEATNYFKCNLCRRYSCGFKYVVTTRDEGVLDVDVRCAEISEPFQHQFHVHPLFLTMDIGSCKVCSVCKSKYQHLNCIEAKCEFSLCFHCSTLQYKVRYEYDEHFLTFSYEENASLSWCELCEETIGSPKYTCNECGVTLHIKCLLGNEASYMKPSQNVMLNSIEINVVANNSLTRPICHRCKRRCEDKVRYEDDGGNILCSYSELWRHYRSY